MTSPGSHIGLGAAGLCGAVATVLVADRSAHQDVTTLEGMALAAVGVAFVGAGLVAARRRVGNLVGTLLAALGLAVFAWNLTLANDPVVYSVGLALSLLWFGLLVHVLAVYPSGRFDSALARVMAFAGYGACVLQLAKMPWLAAEAPRNVFLVVANRSVTRALTWVQIGIGLAIVALAVIVLTRRWRRSTSLQRRSLTPVLGAIAAVVIVLVGGAVLRRLFGFTLEEQGWFLVLSLLALPVALLVGFLRARLTHARIGELAVRLREDGAGPAALTGAIAWALEDPSLRVAYWAPNIGGFVDGDGRPVDLSQPPHDRASRIIEHEGHRVAALLYDAALDDDPDLIEAVAATAGMYLENAQLRADLRAQLAELHASRARIMTAGDTERKRLERNLHDGAQQRLVALGLALRMARAHAGDGTDSDELLEEAEQELRQALQELRELAQGLHPAVLSEGGLRSALEALAERATIRVQLSDVPDDRLPETVESTVYFVVSEALANVAKHAHADVATVTVGHTTDIVSVRVSDDGVGGADRNAGSGLTGLADRVGALGGRLTVASPPNRGTTIEAVIPCASS